MRTRPAAATAVAVAALALGLASSGPRGQRRQHREGRRTIVSATTRDGRASKRRSKRRKSKRRAPRQRVSNGELLYRMKDTIARSSSSARSSKSYPDTPSMLPDALWLRGETYYAAQRLSRRAPRLPRARRSAETSRASNRTSRRRSRVSSTFVLARATSRTLDDVFAKFNQVPPAQVDAALHYAKGKAYYAKGIYGDAQQQFSQVADRTRRTRIKRVTSKASIAMKHRSALDGARSRTAHPREVYESNTRRRSTRSRSSPSFRPTPPITVT